MATWLVWAAWFEWRWHHVENPGAGYGFGATFVYRHGLVVALITSAIIGAAFYARRSRRPRTAVSIDALRGRRR